ncbi:MAG: hypothetical protein E7408_07150 [Ruminococcaceae bacterium]|nr:hypothetical protein [Oscillospiraceae bacterium]
MKMAKKMLSGLLVLMLLAGLMVMPAAAAEEATEYVVNGDFEDTTGITYNVNGTVNTDAVTSMPGWYFPDGWVLQNGKTVLVKPGDEGYKGYGAELTENHGNYITIVQNDSQVVPITQTIGLEPETVYTVSIMANGAWDGIRFDITYSGLTAEETALLNPEIKFEKNTGTDYYIWNGDTNYWKKVSFNLVLPAGATGISLGLRTHNTSSAISFDDISIQKATNMISTGSFQWPTNEMAVSRADACGDEHWYATDADGAVIGASFDGGYGYVKGGSKTLNQHVPVKDGTLYKFRINGWGDQIGRTLKMKMTFPEDASYTIEKEFTVTASSSCVNEAYIYIDGNFTYNDIPQSLTEAKLTLYGDATDANPALTGTPVFWLKSISLTEVDPITVGTNISALEEGENTVTANATIFKKAWGGMDKAMLVVASYEGNRFVNLDLKSLAVAAEADSASDTATVTATKGTHTVKVFLWNAEKGLMPLQDEIELR